MKSKLTITWNRMDGTERARFDNFEDALLFAKAKERKKGDSDNTENGN